ncbi:MAG: response regulator transcription factor [Kiritimatiellae bacterium]|nr:response regulator transcription factor [Kiritimatiellia bacterium]
MSAPSRVLIVDDRQLVADAFSLAIERELGLCICGVAATAGAALSTVASKRPQLVLINLSLQQFSGVELIKRMLDVCPETRILAYALCQDDSTEAERALLAGATGYVAQSDKIADMIQAIRRVIDGRLHVSEPLQLRLLGRVRGKPGLLGNEPEDVLSDREYEVFKMIGHGSPTKAIARRLGVSAKTVETYRERIREKMNLKDGWDLLQCAILHTHNHNGFVPVEVAVDETNSSVQI